MTPRDRRADQALVERDVGGVEIVAQAAQRGVGAAIGRIEHVVAELRLELVVEALHGGALLGVVEARDHGADRDAIAGRDGGRRRRCRRCAR